MKKVFSTLVVAFLVTGFATTTVHANNRFGVSLDDRAKVEFKHDFQKQIDRKNDKDKEIPRGIEKKIKDEKRTPKLSNIMVVDREETSVHIVWLTGERTDSKVWVSTSRTVDTNGTPKASSADMAFVHNIAITGLTPDTEYYYVVASTDSSGNTSKSEVKSFMTKVDDEDSDAAPRITAIRINGILATAATLTWTSNEEVTARILVSTSSSVSEQNSRVFTASEFKKTGKIGLTSLSANTTYYYTLEVTDRSGNKTKSEVKTFKTNALDTTLPTIWGPFVLWTSETSARIVWITNEKTDSKVWVGTSSSVSTSGVATESSDRDAYMHSIVVTGLNANTNYRFVVGSADASGNQVLSAVANFTTNE